MSHNCAILLATSMSIVISLVLKLLKNMKTNSKLPPRSNYFGTLISGTTFQTVLYIRQYTTKNSNRDKDSILFGGQNYTCLNLNKKWLPNSVTEVLNSSAVYASASAQRLYISNSELQAEVKGLANVNHLIIFCANRDSNSPIIYSSTQ